MKLWESREEKERDIVEIVPTDILTDDKDFFGYIHESNTRYSLKKSSKKHYPLNFISVLVRSKS